MGNKILILHKTDDANVYRELESTASLESLCAVLEGVGFEILSAHASSSLWGVEFTRSDLVRSYELAFMPEPVALHMDYVSDPAYYASLCRWIREQLPDHLPVHVWGDSGHPLFEVDFDNLEEQIRAQVPL